jgi:beta-lactam-binding protein with PASTA domain
VRVCPSCQRENPDDTDFCQNCGEYLRWDPTVATPVVRPPDSGQGGPGPAQVPPGMRPIPGTRGDRSPADAVSITLRSLQTDADPREGVRAAAAPGQTTSLVASVRNQSGIVDNYDLRVEGLPDAWWTITPATAYLVPYGAPSGRYEMEAQVHLHPPRAAAAEARDWPIRVVARSRASDSDAGSASARLSVQSYQDLETELRPERATGRRRGRFAFAVRNLANAPIELEFAAVDPEAKCKFAIKQKRGIAQPGKRTGTELIVKAPKQIWVGRPLDRPFDIIARAPGSEDTLISRQAVFRQRPWFAWWVPIALVTALALGVAGYKLLQHPPTIAAPNLEGKAASAVQKFLESHGLLLSNSPVKTKVVQAANQVGKVVGQNPGPGFKMKPGQALGIVVGVAAKQVPVPNVCGKKLGDAQTALKAAGLSTGPVQPSIKDANAMTLATGCEAPSSGSVAQGTPISLFLQSPGGGNVPSVANAPADQAAKTLQAAGLKTVTIPVLKTDVAPGTVVAQRPDSSAKVAKGSTVYLYASAFPRIAYDTGTAIDISSFDLQGPAGAPAALTTAGSAASEPSWNSDQTELAYVDHSAGGGSIEVVAADGSSSPQAVAQGSATTDYHRPVFAPLAGSTVLAFTEWISGTQSALCFADISQSPIQPSCTAPVPELLDRPAWSADGTQVDVIADTAGTTPGPEGVLAFTTAPTTPAAAQAASWQTDGTMYLKRPDSSKDPTFLAWSPAVAGVSQLAYTSGNSIFITSSPTTTGTKLTDVSTFPPALAWRTDGQLIVGSQSCATAPQPISSVGQTGTLTSLRVNGCNPSVEPLPLPPTS